MNRTFATLGFLSLCLSTAAGAQMRPASLGYEDPDKRFENLLAFPSVQGKLTVNLSCFSQVQDSGKMEETACYMKDQFDQPFAAAVAKAAKKGRMTPAIIGGKARTVYVQFRVNFVADGEKNTITIYLNPGYEENVEAYGDGHIAGQRAFHKKEPWMKVCPRSAKYSVWARAYLGEDGKADSVSIVHANGIMPTAACQDSIKQTVLGSQYTPAYAEGEPVPSSYVELFGN
jgi:hypothetical protein